MQQDTTRDNSKNIGHAEKILKTTEVFRITRPENVRNEHLVAGVFRVTRPAIMKNGDISKTTDSSQTTETVSSQSTRYEQFNNGDKSLYAEQKIVPTFATEKRSGYRNKQLMSCNNHNAILLPRPQNPIQHQTLSGTHVQRIPVLNNTYFQLPKNAPNDTQFSFANNMTRNDLNSISIPTELSQDNQKIPTNSNEKVNVINTDYSDLNNNSRVRNTQKYPKAAESEAECSISLDRNCKDLNKRNNNLGTTGNNVVKMMSHQNVCCEQVEPKETKDMSACLKDSGLTKSECCNEPSKTTNSQNKDLLADSIPKNIPSTSQCFEGKNTCNAFKDVQQNLPITDTLDLTNADIEQNKRKGQEFEASTCLKIDNTTAQRSKDGVTEHSVTIPLRKSRKRTYKEAEHTSNNETTHEDTKTAKKGYVITNKCAYKKTTKTQEGTESELFPKNSKVFQDMESRYMRRDLTGSTSVEKVFEDKCDIINKVESEKLSEVKDHHLLKLSDKERKYLRSKCYLENDLVKGVRRRFENSPDNKNEMKCDHYTRDLQMNDSLRKEAKQSSDLNSESSEILSHADVAGDEASPNDASADKTNYQYTIEKPRSRRSGKKQQENSPFIDQLKSLIHLKRPVVRLQHIDCLSPEKKQSTIISKPEKQETATTKLDDANSSPTPKKMFYVVSSSEFSKLNKQGDCASGVICADSNTYPSQSKIEPITGSTVTKDKQINTIISQSLVKSTSSHSETTQKFITGPTSNKVKLDKQPQINVASTLLNKMVCNSFKGLTDSPETQRKTYSNKLTVKELLQAKRDESKISPVTSRQMLDKAKRTVSYPVQLYGRAMYSKSKNSENVSSNTSMKVINSNIAMNVMAIKTDMTSKSHANDTQQNIHRNILPIQTGRTIHIVNPHTSVPTSIRQQPFIAPKPQSSLPDDGSKANNKVVPPKVHSSDGVHNIVTCHENIDKKPTYFKIGDQTVIVKRSEDRISSKRKTLPAPKSKRTIADDYKRRRRRSRDRFTQKMHRKSLGSNLRKIIKESDNTVFKMMYSLDLVPVEILKQVSAVSRESDSEPNTPIKNGMCQQRNFDRNVVEICAEDESSLKSKPLERNSKMYKRSTNMASIVQINKLKDETVTFSIEQIKVQYRKPESVKNNTSFSNIGRQCRLKFSARGIIEKIYVENLGQGLYLVKNTNGDKTELANRQKLNTCLVPYPAYIHTIPNGSLSIAVGEIYLEQQKAQYVFKNDDKDVQSVLDKFLYPSTTLKKIDDCFDKRYSSITDKNMSPRCNSPMFYSKEMKNTFDDFIEEGTIASEYTKINLSRRSETNLTKLDLQTTRFSERAMALKIKQNELFESCRRLKSENTTKVGTKKKRDKSVLITAAKTENLKSKNDGGVKVLNNPHDAFAVEKSCTDVPIPKETTTDDDKIIDVDE